jgi:hypothetical protein
MIISSMCSDLYHEVTISLMSMGILRLFEEIPVCEVYPPSWSEED